MAELLALYVYVLAHIHASSYAPATIEEGCIDGREASFAASAVEALKASRPQGQPMSQSPIQVTYGPAMTNTPWPLLSVWVLRGGECNVIVHVMTEARPPGRNAPLCFQPG